ncbi:TPA: DNA repair protein RecN [Candidatus Galligastranaerophilus faecipullorum]|nr:DNA repair protein RecN [Candidatus Galligastranaerophilus faecipullorum]
MIKSVLIKNFILIDELFLEFENGFNVLIGETGAGKSIILKAIDTVLGARVQKDVIFDKSKPALIEITFAHSEKEKEFLQQYGLCDETVISREITPSSQKCRLNGALVNLDYIKEMREHLADIHSQNQSYTYVMPKHHIELLDAYVKSIDEEFLKNYPVYREAFTEYQDVTKRLALLRENNSRNLQEIDFLKFQLNEIDSAQIGENEEAELERELDVLSNIQTIKELSAGIYYTLGDDSGVLDALSKMNGQLSRACEYDAKLEEVQSSFIEAHENLKFCSDYLREYSQNLEDNPQRLEEINDRLSLILKLKRKYGDIFEAREKFEKELSQIEGDFGSLDELEKREKELLEKINDLALKMSQARKKYSIELADLIAGELRKLELSKAEFEIQIKEKKPDAKGIDDVEFMITTNVSSALAPLAKVASGGEISRVMLAIKCVFAKVDSLPSIIFDEIDTGISGKASNSVAEAISNLAKNIQVFAITHQPQIAARADAYFRVTKSQDEKTKVSAEKLRSRESVLEALASMASGEVNNASVSFARELLKS